MRVATAPPESTSDLETLVGEVLDRRLRAPHPRPLAVALSGGGDSLALLLIAEAWARRVDRRLVVLAVDHRLRPASAGWTAACAATAAHLRRPFPARAWEGDKPTAGLPAAARSARHRLLADAARAAGARVILMGHTADDRLEAQIMRAAGSSTPSPREWGPSPVWPQARGVFLLRPMLGVARGDLRTWLSERGERWIEDPANTDLAYARPRARRDLNMARPAAMPDAEETSARDLATACRSDGGALQIARAALRVATPACARRFIAAACLCAAGTDRPPGAGRVESLVDRLIATGDVTATLAGARIEADALEVRFQREAGEASRGGLAPLSLATGETGVWDGRFEVTAGLPITVRRLAGLARRLPREDQQAVRALPASLRPTLPVVIDEVGTPALAVALPLALPRLLAACGAVDREPA